MGGLSLHLKLLTTFTLRHTLRHALSLSHVVEEVLQ
jgi:hypothetical protein